MFITPDTMTVRDIAETVDLTIAVSMYALVDCPEKDQLLNDLESCKLKILDMQEREGRNLKKETEMAGG